MAQGGPIFDMQADDIIKTVKGAQKGSVRTKVVFILHTRVFSADNFV